MLVRQVAHRLGYRFRLHRRDLPAPISCFRGEKIILVHGCFWRRHLECIKATIPGTRTDFWTRKFAAVFVLRSDPNCSDPNCSQLFPKTRSASFFVCGLWDK
jgi:G:T-mismatch repair DNA endonuclease (very short patch repair protein)